MAEIGKVVDIHHYSPPGFPGLNLKIEIRRMKRTGKYFPRVEHPDGGFSDWSPTYKTKRGALGSGKRAIDFIMEDEPFEDFRNAN